MSTDAATLDAYVEAIELDLPAPSIPAIRSILCEELNLCIDLPMGMTLCASIGADTPDTICNRVESLMAPLSTFLAGLAPLFLIIDVFNAIQACMQAIPEAITSLNPQPIIDCIQGLICAVMAAICGLWPPMAYPAMLISIVNYVKELVNCVLNTILALCEAAERLATLSEIVAEDPANADLQGLLDSAHEILTCKSAAVGNSLGSICDILELVNALIDIVNSLNPDCQADPDKCLPKFDCSAFSYGMSCYDMQIFIEGLQAALNAFTAVVPTCDTC